jgi:hypothetical protein
MTTPYPEPLDVPGPAQSDFLIHFCGRPSGRPHTPMVPAAIQGLTPATAELVTRCITRSVRATAVAQSAWWSRRSLSDLSAIIRWYHPLEAVMTTARPSAMRALTREIADTRSPVRRFLNERFANGLADVRREFRSPAPAMVVPSVPSGQANPEPLAELRTGCCAS